MRAKKTLDPDYDKCCNIDPDNIDIDPKPQIAMLTLGLDGRIKSARQSMDNYLRNKKSSSSLNAEKKYGYQISSDSNGDIIVTKEIRFKALFSNEAINSISALDLDSYESGLDD